MIIPGGILKVKLIFGESKEVWQMSALMIVLGLGALYGLYRFDRWLTN